MSKIYKEKNEKDLKNIDNRINRYKKKLDYEERIINPTYNFLTKIFEKIVLSNKKKE